MSSPLPSFFQENINSCNFNSCWHRAVIPKLQRTWESPAGLSSCRFLDSAYRIFSLIGSGCSLRICILEVPWWWCCWSKDHIFRTCGSHSYWACSSNLFQVFPTVVSSYLLSIVSQALIFTCRSCWSLGSGSAWWGPRACGSDQVMLLHFGQQEFKCYHLISPEAQTPSVVKYQTYVIFS